MPPATRRYTLLLSILVEEENAVGDYVAIGYARTGGNDGLADELARQQVRHGRPSTIIPSGAIGASYWTQLMPEEFRDPLLNAPDPVVLDVYDTVLDALEEIQAFFTAEVEEADAGEAGAGVLWTASRAPINTALSQQEASAPPRQPEEGNPAGGTVRNDPQID